MPKAKAAPTANAVEQAQQIVATSSPSSIQDLVNALVQAINQTKPVEKRNALNRKPGDPWQPKDGSKKLKLKRKIYQHAIPIDPDMETNETIELLNQLKPGSYCDGWVSVKRRRDKGIDIDYPIKTASQRLKLVSGFGITNFHTLVQRLVDEGNSPKAYKVPEDQEDN